MGYKTYIPPKSIFSDDVFKIIEGLQKDNNIYLIKPDKGNGVVIINRTDYNSRMLNILDDNTKFYYYYYSLIIFKNGPILQPICFSEGRLHPYLHTYTI